MNAGYRIDIGNAGPSNISQLFLVDDQTATPSYVQTNQGSCNGLVSGVPTTTSGRLLCSFGALNAGATITVIVAYTTPTSGPPSSFSVTFELNTTGATLYLSRYLVEVGLVLAAFDRHDDLAAAVALLRTSTPWVEAARALAAADYGDAQRILDSIPSIPLRDAAHALAAR